LLRHMNVNGSKGTETHLGGHTQPEDVLT
jgi:hypothetical protein